MAEKLRSMTAALLILFGVPAFCASGGSAAPGAVLGSVTAAPGAARSLPCALYLRMGQEPGAASGAASSAASDAGDGNDLFQNEWDDPIFYIPRASTIAVASSVAPGAASSAASSAAPGAASSVASGTTLGVALPPKGDHIWDELYDLDMPAEDAVTQFMDAFLTSKRDWLEDSLRRMRTYRRSVEVQIAERRMPREFLFLPLVESAYVTRAMSWAGACGLWQIMRPTAAFYGLRMDGWLDERRDFIKSTDVSLKELDLNHRIFGDWAMALAAYNWGSGYLSALVKRTGIRDYWTLRRKGLLPRETAGFVPQLLALARIASHPGRYGLTVGWEEDTVWERIPLSRSVDLRILAEKAGVSYDLLREGNAELVYPLTPPRAYGWQLKVPSGDRKAVEAALADATAPLMEFTLHVIQAGDTLSQIAVDYGVTVDLLR